VRMVSALRIHWPGSSRVQLYTNHMWLACRTLNHDSGHRMRADVPTDDAASGTANHMDMGGTSK
jgi:hypothetical protein